jgi:hypothetical protein
MGKSYLPILSLKRVKGVNTMTLKMYQLIDFPTFYEKVKNQKMSFKTSYRLTLLATEIEKHINYYQEQFRSLLMEYSKKDENGNPLPTDDGQGVLLIEETMNEAYSKLNELRELDVDLPDTKFSPDDFDKLELSPVEMNVIFPFISEE